MVTYKDLCEGYILKNSDTLVLWGYEAEAIIDDRRSFLNFPGMTNSRIFNELFRISAADKYLWAEKFGSYGSGDFPEFTNSTDLTNFVKDIYEHSPYREGDIVIVNELVGSGEDYPYYFSETMAKQKGRHFQISNTEFCGLFEEYYLKKEKYSKTDGCPWKYRLVGDGVRGYNWVSSMFHHSDTSIRPIWFLKDAASTSTPAASAAEEHFGRGSSSVYGDTTTHCFDSEEHNDKVEIITLPKKVSTHIKL